MLIYDHYQSNLTLFHFSGLSVAFSLLSTHRGLLIVFANEPENLETSSPAIEAPRLYAVCRKFFIKIYTIHNTKF